MKISQNDSHDALIEVDDLVVEPGLRRVTRRGEEIPLPGLSFDLLMVLIEAAPNLVPPDRMIEQVWEGQLVSPETLTQRVKLLRDALGDDVQNPRYIAGVRGRGYRLIAEVRRGGATRPETPSPRRHLPRWIAGAAIVVAALAALFGSRGFRTPEAPARIRALAIIPFENRSERAEDAFFADGIHDDLLTRLSRIRDLRVIARGSMRNYRAGQKAVPEIARELGVGAVLTGAVQRSGDHVRIQVQLTDASDAQLWAETYDRSLTVENIFAIQSDISRAIASKLAITLGNSDRARLDQQLTSSLDAYEAWLRGRQEMNRYTESGLGAAVGYFQEALAADPEFAQAHVAMAETRLLQSRFRFLDRALAIQLAESSVERALALDPALAEAFAAKGDVLRLRGNDEAAEAALRQAIALNPNLAGAWVSYGWLLAEKSGWDEQKEMWRRAAALDPHSPAVRVYGAFADLRRGQVAEAETQLQSLLGQQPDFPPGHVILAEVRAARGDQVGAIAHYRRALELNPHLPLAYIGLVHALLDVEADEEARAAVDEAWSVPDTPDLGPSLELLFASTRPTRTEAEREALLESADDLRESDPLEAASQSALLHLAAGRAGQARAELEAAEPRLRDSPRSIPIRARLGRITCTYAFTLLRSGEADRARDLAESALAQMEGTSDFAPNRRVAPLVCFAVLGRTDAALKLLQSDSGSGRVPSGWRHIVARPELDSIRTHPQFDRLVTEIRSEAALHRKRAFAGSSGAEGLVREAGSRRDNN